MLFRSTLVNITPQQKALWENDFQKAMLTSASNSVIDKDLYQEIITFLKKLRGE